MQSNRHLTISEAPLIKRHCLKQQPFSGMIFPGLLDQMIYLLLSEHQVKIAAYRSHSSFADKVKVYKNVKMEVNKEAYTQPSLSIKLGQWIIYCRAKVFCFIMNQEWHVILRAGKENQLFLQRKSCFINVNFCFTFFLPCLWLYCILSTNSVNPQPTSCFLVQDQSRQTGSGKMGLCCLLRSPIRT